jgi:hypothetical protein
MPRARQRGVPIGNRLLQFGLLPNSGVSIPQRGDVWYVDTFNGKVGAPGTSWDSALSTMAAALSKAQTHDTVCFVGDVREEITGSNLKFDITIIGCGMPHHADQPGSGSTLYDPASSMWRAPASPTATTPLLKVRGRGWKFINIAFDCPVDAAAVYLERNASSGTDEYDSSHAQFINCRFTDGKVGIENAGGASHVRVKDCWFTGLTESGGAGIKCTSTSVAVPLRWRIEDNQFHNNASHILSSMSYSTIKGNTFGRFTATLSIDIDDQPSANQGEYNVIWMNYLSGTYGQTAYPPGSNNEWGGNANSLSGGWTAADPA